MQMIGLRVVQAAGIFLFACSQPRTAEVAPTTIHECYPSPLPLGEAVGDSHILDAESLSRFRERLDRTGVEYTLNTPDPALRLPTPKCPECQARRYDRIMYLVLARSRATRTLERYRVYLDGDRPTCIEDDFAYKNPYQS